MRSDLYNHLFNELLHYMGNNTATTATSQPLLSDFQIIEVQPDTGDTLLLSTSTGK